MEKLKTAREVREEIFAKYFELRGMVGDGFAAYKGSVPSIEKETCFGERDCLDVIRTKDDILDEILHDYFMPPTENMGYTDFAGNVYRSISKAIDSLDNDLYNQKSISKRINSGEVSFNGREI